MTANICNFSYDAGTDIAFAFPVQNPDGSPFAPTGLAASGYSVSAEIKDNASSATARLVLPVVLDTPQTSWAQTTITHAATVTALPATGLSYAQLTAYYWEWYLTDPAGSRTRLLEGSFSVSPGGQV